MRPRPLQRSGFTSAAWIWWASVLGWNGPPSSRNDASPNGLTIRVQVGIHQLAASRSFIRAGTSDTRLRSSHLLTVHNYSLFARDEGRGQPSDLAAPLDHEWSSCSLGGEPGYNGAFVGAWCKPQVSAKPNVDSPAGTVSP